MLSETKPQVEHELIDNSIPLSDRLTGCPELESAAMVLQGGKVAEPTPYAKYRIGQYGARSHHQPDYEDVRVRPSLQTRITFGEGLKSPAELFGSLKKAGQRFVGADQIVGANKIPHKFVGKSSAGNCQCRHHQKKLLGKSCEDDNHKTYPISEETNPVEGHYVLKYLDIST